MTSRHVAPRARPRRGAALMIAVVTLAVVAVLTTAVVAQLVAGRRLLDRRPHRLQAEWLARAGVELAVARLLADPADYRGETVEPVPGSDVRIKVRPDPAAPDLFRVTSEARYPEEGPGAVRRSVTCTLRRTRRGNEVGVERVPEGLPPAPAGAPLRGR
jgi:hypothetical protein